MANMDDDLVVMNRIQPTIGWNRLAAIEGLRNVPAGAPVEIVTDSKYLSKGISKWLPKWKQDRWKTG